MKNVFWVVSVSLLLLLGFFQSSSAATFDHSLFDGVLKEYVNDQGRIDYNGIAKETLFSDYLESLKTAPVQDLSEDGRLAFWINAYNAITIDKVIKWKPKKSVRETFIPGVWTSTKFYTSREHTVAGTKMSPDDIEHETLRKQYLEPRIHFAIICASSSCPPQPRFAYTGEKVRSQLESETRMYMQSPRGVKIDRAENTLYLSKVLDWFEEDFVQKSGSVMEFIKPYLDDETLAFLERMPKIAYLHYDWALNAQEPLK